MRFTHIALTNFLSYEAQEIPLGSLSYAAVAGANGSGKSSIPLAVAWALFGTARVRSDSDSVIRDGADQVSVTLDFEAEGTTWRIERGKRRGKSAKVRLYSMTAQGEWSPFGDHLNSTAQERINDLVGMSEDAFYSLTLIDGQSGVRFIRADSSARRDILLNLLPEMAHWAQYEAEARAQLTALRSAVEATVARIEADEERVDDLRAQDRDVAEQIDAIDVDSLSVTRKSLTKDIAALEKEIAAVGEAERKALAEAEREHEASVRERWAAMASDRDALKALRSQVSYLRSQEEEVRRLTVDLASLQEAREQAKEHVKDAQKDAKQARARAKQAAADADAVIERSGRRADVLRAAIDANTKSLVSLREAHDEHAVACPTCRADLSDDAIMSLISRLEDEIAEAEQDVARLDDEVERARERDREARRASDEAERAHEAAQAALERYDADIANSEEQLARAESSLSAMLAEAGVDAVEPLQRRLDDLQAKVEAAEDKHDAWLAQQEKVLAGLRDAVDAAQSAAGVAQRREHLREVVEQERAVSERLREADRLRGRLESIRDDIRSVAERIRERRESIQDSAQRIEALEQVVQACRPQGVPSMLLDGVLAPIENEATRILNSVPGGEGMVVRFEQARALKSRDGAREVLDIVVTLPNGAERMIESLSAGETVRVSMAIVFAMIAVLGQRRGGDYLKTVFLDEPLGPLDAEAVPAFVEVLRSAVSLGTLSSVLVVSHDPRVIEALPQRVEVERSETGASVVSLVA